MPEFGDTGEGSGGRYQYQGQVDPNAPSVSNGMITPQQWQEYQRRRHRAALLGILGTLGGTAGLGALGQMFGGAAGAGSGAWGTMGSVAGSPYASVTGGLGSAAGGAGAAGGILGGAGAAAGTGAAGAAGAVGAAGGAAGGAAAGASQGLLGGLTARDLLALGTGLTGMVGGAMSNGPETEPTSATSDPMMKELIDLMMGRLRRSEPLHQSVLDMANGLLPTQYQRPQGGGGGMP